MSSVGREQQGKLGDGDIILIAKLNANRCYRPDLLIAVDLLLAWHLWRELSFVYWE